MGKPLIRPFSLLLLLLIGAPLLSLEIPIGKGKGEVAVAPLSAGGGQFTGQFNGPTSLFIDTTDRLHLVDTLNFKVEIFDLVAGKHLASIDYKIESPQQQPNLISDLTVAENGEITLLDYSHQLIITLDQAGVFLGGIPLNFIISQFPEFRAAYLARHEEFFLIWDTTQTQAFQLPRDGKNFLKLPANLAPFLPMGIGYSLSLDRRDSLNQLVIESFPRAGNFAPGQRHEIEFKDPIDWVELVAVRRNTLYFSTVSSEVNRFYRWEEAGKTLVSLGKLPLEPQLHYFRRFGVDSKGTLWYLHFPPGAKKFAVLPLK